MPKSLSMTRCVWMKQLTKKLIQFYQIYQKKSLDSEDFDMKIITFVSTTLFISRQFFNYMIKSIAFPSENIRVQNRKIRHSFKLVSRKRHEAQDHFEVFQ